MQELLVYGTSWSVASWDVRRLLDVLEEPYQFVDLEADGTALIWAMRVSQGDLIGSIPIVQMGDGSVLLGATRQLLAQQFGIRLDTGLFRRDRSEADGTASV